jgi:arsenite methyltransferase
MAYFDDEAARRLEALYKTEAIMHRRKALLQILRLVPGERVLDIGAGSGFVALDMADPVGPTGAILGIDVSESMLGLARARCAEKPWVKFEIGDATQLQIPDAAFDVAVSVQVFEYIRDIDLALAEMHRVLRPGGRAAIISTDWKSIAWSSSDETRMQKLLSVYAEHCAHQDLPRRLGPKAEAAGFEISQEQLLPLYHRNFGPETYSHYLMTRFRSFVPGRQGVSEQDVVAWADDLQQLSEQGNYFFCLTQYLFALYKPG